MVPGAARSAFAGRPTARTLWQGDVCRGPPLRIGDTVRPVRIHALLDDASRYVVALCAMHVEREIDTIAVPIQVAPRA